MVPLWLWFTIVAATVATAVLIAHDDPSHCATCGRRLPRRTRIVERYSDGRAEVCLECFMETFR